MKNIVLISHGPMAEAVKTSLEMIVGRQDHVHAVTMPAYGDNLQFEHDLKEKIRTLEGEKLIIADLLGGSPCNTALKNYAEDKEISVIAGMTLPMVLEVVMNDGVRANELIEVGRSSIVDVKEQLQAVESAKTEEKVDLAEFLDYKGKADLVNVRIDERLIHGQVAGIWAASLNTQRIIVANDEAAADELQKSSLRMAAPASIRLSVLPVEAAAQNINSGKYGMQRIFLLFKNPADVLKFIKAGGRLTTVNVGNMSYKEGAKEITRSIKVMPQEEEIFKEIFSSGVKITAQLVPNDPVIDLMDKLNS
ncbi:PTS mannose/fructose/sorbose transporter subunit IIAB [Lactovum odontotermitis]